MTTASEVIQAVLPEGVPPELVTRFEELHAHAWALAKLIDGAKIRECIPLGSPDTQRGLECGMAASTPKYRCLARGYVRDNGPSLANNRIESPIQAITPEQNEPRQVSPAPGSAPAPKPTDASVGGGPQAYALIEICRLGLPRFKIACPMAKERKATIHIWRS